jgi:hypothetical protein
VTTVQLIRLELINYARVARVRVVKLGGMYAFKRQTAQTVALEAARLQARQAAQIGGQVVVGELARQITPSNLSV